MHNPNHYRSEEKIAQDRTQLIVLLYTVIVLLMLLLAIKCQASETIDLDIVAEIESSHNSKAVNGKAIGLYQITPSCLRDFNIQTKSNIKSDQLFDPVYNTLIADYYLNKRLPELLIDKNKPVTVDNLLVAYTWGIKHVGEALPKEVRDYVIRYHLLKAQKILKESK